MQLKDLDSRTVTISNEWIATNANEYTMKWEVVKNGTAVENGTMDVDIPAGSSKEVVIPFTTPTDAAAGDEYFLNISFVTKSDDQFTWAKKDFAVAEAQFELDSQERMQQWRQWIPPNWKISRHLKKPMVR